VVEGEKSHLSGVAEVFAGLHFKIEGFAFGGMGLDDFLNELQVDRVFGVGGELVGGLKVEPQKKGPFGILLEIEAALDVENFRDFEEVAAGLAQHPLNSGVVDFGGKLEKDEVVDHGTGMIGGPVTSTAPIKRSFFDRVDISDHENGNEAQHAPENDRAMDDHEFAEDNRPREHKNNLDIKKNEEHGDEVKFDTESRLRAGVGNHSALVGHVFGCGSSPGPSQNEIGKQGDGGKSHRHDHMK